MFKKILLISAVSMSTVISNIAAMEESDKEAASVFTTVPNIAAMGYAAKRAYLIEESARREAAANLDRDMKEKEALNREAMRRLAFELELKEDRLYREQLLKENEENNKERLRKIEEKNRAELQAKSEKTSKLCDQNRALEEKSSKLHAKVQENEELIGDLNERLATLDQRVALFKDLSRLLKSNK